MQFSSDWFSHHKEGWSRIFQAVGWDNSQEKIAIEIGSFEGRSTLWTLENLLKHDASRIYCLDTWEGGVEHEKENFSDVWDRFNHNISELDQREKVIIKRGMSKHSLISLLGEGISADFLYVDGSHQAQDVLSDLVLGFELLKSGGVVICDDYVWMHEAVRKVDILNNPKIAIDAFVNINRRNIKIIHGLPLIQFAFVKI